MMYRYRSLNILIRSRLDDNNFDRMKVFMKLFETELDKYLNLENFVDAKVPPQKLLRELKETNGKKLAKAMETSTSNHFKIIRMMSIANLLLIYSRNYFDLVEEHLKPQLSKDQWINTKFLEPYYRFIIKCCTSKDNYNDSKGLALRKDQTMQMLFYSINMLRLLFKVVEKMPLIGRYYKNKNDQAISSVIEIIAVQAQRLYDSFKNSLSEILINREYFVKNRKEQNIIRGILMEDLIYINEQMKKLFLDKYFYPLGQGITVKLYKPEQHSQEVQQTYKSIISNHEETERQKRREELECTLFPGSGLVNWNFYQQTLLSGPMLNVTIHDSTNFVELDDIVISEEDEEKVKEVPLQVIQEKKQTENLQDTNTGTMQIKGKDI